MKDFKKIIDQEENRLKSIVDDIRFRIDEDKADSLQLNNEIKELKRQKLDSLDWHEKDEIGKRIQECRRRMSMRTFQDPIILQKPYFGIIELDDDYLGLLSYCLGTRSCFGQHGRVLVVDWREAPISRLYYEYNSGDGYDEDIMDRERSGIIASKLKVDTTDSILWSIVDHKTQYVKNKNNEWNLLESGKITSNKENKGDHRLPEITAFISQNQFKAITHPSSRIFLLQGGAGSGKTTVGLHRIAYLNHNDPERFRPEKILVVVFNKSLQKYISGVLPALNVESGVQIDTFHSWSGKLFKKANINILYNSNNPSPEVLQFKKNSQVLKLVDAYIEKLYEKSKKWFIKKMSECNVPDMDSVINSVNKTKTYHDFFNFLKNNPLKQEQSNHYRNRLLNRLSDHLSDLHGIFSEIDLINNITGYDKYKSDTPVGEQIANWQQHLKKRNRIDFADSGILLYLLQIKGVHEALPAYSHIMVDEAQDLSEVELSGIINASDHNQSITICGDMAQKIKSDVSFQDLEGFAGFIKKFQNNANKSITAETLMVGYRASKPVMELAWHVLNEKPSMDIDRDGPPVELIKTNGYNDSVLKIIDILKQFTSDHPKALVGIICRLKAEADQFYNDLINSTLKNIRRHERDDFSFIPGVIVTNAHQVKGLEFSAVIIIDPSTEKYRDDNENRMLLHVAITRASDHLWIIGHHTPAYDMEGFLKSAG